MDPVSTPPSSPMSAHPTRASIAANMRTPRSSSRLSMGGARPAGSRASDEDSKTAVKVVVRVRPPLQPSDPGFDLIPQRFRASTCQATTPTNLVVQSPQGKKLFVFDRVFGEDVTQQGIWDYLSDSVGSFVQGYNVSILAYGQSGAGKSHTMGTAGNEAALDPSSAGIVPRAAAALFEKLNSPPPPGPHAPSTPGRKGIRSPQRYSIPAVSSLPILHRQMSSERTWQLKATYVEIYNEQLRDLLLPSSTPESERPQVSIREDTKGHILPTGLTQVAINSVDDLLNALSHGSAIRQTDATSMNAKSSRSHAVFSLNLVQKRTPSASRRASVQVDASPVPDASVTVDSKLHFVDLAGSERLKNTGAQGDRAREGISINAGLASLGKVISQLSTGKQGAYISYRDSRLTRLLQDSLGGNAITYMVACVTPVEFHLSETLNTVTYAQRARAIQSRPEIQQTQDEADKAGVIARLQAEVAFLRERVNKNNEKSEQRLAAAGDRPDRRETELHDQLMDMQEGYTALSQRHAKLIAEISKARDDHGEGPPVPGDAAGESAVERLERSNSFAEAVEQVVMEYEKTIQALETSLSNTRSSLSTTESTLMERESKIAYMESLAQQLQARVQKANEREANNDAYLRELEAQIEGATTSGEKSASLVASLRKELGRVKETENNSEEYISTLEEKLAEAEQDREITQREMDRLETVIERQRSIGRLDNLLAELDNIRHSDRPKQTGGRPSKTGQGDPFVDQPRPTSSRRNAQDEDTEEETADVDAGSAVSQSQPVPPSEPDTQPDPVEEQHDPVAGDERRRRDEQARFMADKLEITTQELFDLRSEHETTVNDYDDLQRKYELALQTLAKLQEASEDNDGPASRDSEGSEAFLRDARVNGMKEDGQHASSSRSLESELSLQEQSFTSSTGESTTGETSEDGPAVLEESDDCSTVVDEGEPPLRPEERALAQEMEILRQLHVQRESSLKEITDNYARLTEEHRHTLSQVEDLKLEVQRAQLATTRQSPSLVKPVIRRKPSQDLMSNTTSTDRAMRSFASLRNIALDNFEGNVDVRQNFEIHLNTIMGDLHDRTEKLQALDTEVAAARNDLEKKAAMIAGLTRERASIQASPNIDFSVVGQMRDQLMESEQQIKSLHDNHAVREKDLQNQIDEMRRKLDERQPNAETDTTAGGGRSLDGGTDGAAATENEHVSRLERQLSEWESKHAQTVVSLKDTETSLLATIATLEASLSEAHKSSASRDIELEAQRKQDTLAAEAAAASLEQERAQHGRLVETLQNQISDYRSASEEHNEKLERLEQAYSSIKQQFDEDTKTKELNDKELQTHRQLISNLEDQIEHHKSAIVIHEQNLEALNMSHSEELEGIQAAMAAAEKESLEKHVALEEQHKTTVEGLQRDLERSQTDLEELLSEASDVLGYETDVGRFRSHLSDYASRQRELEGKTAANDGVGHELEAALSKVADLETQMSNLKMANQELLLNLEKVQERERKSTALVQELEDQLNSTFDEHQAATNRMSAMQTERQVQLDEAQQAKGEVRKELEDAKLKISLLESQLVELQRRSLASNSRDSLNYMRESLSPEAAAFALARSSSQNSIPRPKSNATIGNASAPSGLPSPPPAIPLPPIPTPSLGSLSPILGASTPMGLGIDARTASPALGTSILASSPPGTPSHTNTNSFNAFNAPPPPDPGLHQVIEEQESRIRTIEKHLYAEKQLTATLEEALVDLEGSQNKTRQELDGWRKKCAGLEDELVGLRKEKSSSRASLQQVEEERERRQQAERARQALEERMRELNMGHKKKKGGVLNCF